MRLLLSLLVGSLLGVIGAKILFVGSGFSLLPWALVGLSVGIYARAKKEAAIGGIVYGFFLSLVFMISGYNGSRPLVSVMPFFILLGIFGAFCGGVIGIVGFMLRKKVK